MKSLPPSAAQTGRTTSDTQRHYVGKRLVACSLAGGWSSSGSRYRTERSHIGPFVATLQPPNTAARAVQFVYFTENGDWYGLPNGTPLITVCTGFR